MGALTAGRAALICAALGFFFRHPNGDRHLAIGPRTQQVQRGK
jgi:hypothetical protein